jgi:hypothetical protein
MRGHLALVFLDSLISRAVLGGDLEPVRVGRYSAMVPGPSPEQTDPLAVPVHVEFPLSAPTVGRALEDSEFTSAPIQEMWTKHPIPAALAARAISCAPSTCTAW